MQIKRYNSGYLFYMYVFNTFSVHVHNILMNQFFLITLKNGYQLVIIDQHHFYHYT